MDPTDECMVSGTLGFVFRVSQMYGVACLSIQRKRNGWRISSSRAAYIFQATIIYLLGIQEFFKIVMVFFRDDDMIFFNIRDRIVVTSAASSLIVELVLLGHIYSGTQRIKNTIACLQQVQKINTELVCYSPHRSYEKTERLMALWAIISGHSVVIFFFCLDVANFPYAEIDRQGIFSIKKQGEILLWHVALIFATYIKFLMTKVLALQISLILTEVFSSFNHLNDCLNYLSEKIHKDYTSQEISEAVNKIIHLYECLFDVVQVLGSDYGIVLVPLFLYFMINLAMAFYMLIFEIFIAVKSYNSPWALLSWVAYYFIDILIILEPCHRTLKQMNRTKYLVSQLMRYTHPTDYKLMTELGSFYEHLMNKEVIYAPLKIFVLDREFLLKSCGSVVTYVFVVIQLQKRNY